MASKQVTTRLNEDEDRRFKETARAIGTTPSDALRMFVAAFNAAGGFPFTPRIRPTFEAFDSEDDAMRFATHLARKLSDAQG